MKYKQIINILLACMLLFSCSFIPAEATNVDAPTTNGAILRISGRLSHSLPADDTILITQPFSLEKDDTIKYDCTYTPKSASIDFGYVDSNNVFHYLNCTSGSINKTIRINQTGEYTLAIRNNENYAVTVSGTREINFHCIVL